MKTIQPTAPSYRRPMPTLECVTWRKNPPTANNCHLLFGGWEYAAERFSGTRGSYIRVFPQTQVTPKSGASFQPPEEFARMRAVMVAVMNDSDETRARLATLYEDGKLRIEEIARSALAYIHANERTLRYSTAETLAGEYLDRLPHYRGLLPLRLDIAADLRKRITAKSVDTQQAAREGERLAASAADARARQLLLL